jgi:hypothetical protein
MKSTGRILLAAACVEALGCISMEHHEFSTP